MNQRTGLADPRPGRLRPRIAALFLQKFVLWWTPYGRTIARHVRVTHRRVRGVDQTHITINHPTSKRHGDCVCFHFTTTPQFLPPSRFTAEDREEVNRALEQPEKGRVLYCRAVPTMDLIAALAYHVPHRRSERILIRCLAVRTDAQNQQSAFCAL